MIQEDADEALVARCQNGDGESFATLVSRYERPVFNLAFRMLGNVEDARDVAQAAFLKALENLHRFDPRYRFFSWLYRIAMNEALMRIRKNKHRPRSLEVVDEDGERREIDVEDWSPRPVERLLTKELGGKLDRAIARLPEDYRGAFLLRDVEGLSNEQIAKAMKLSVPAVKSRIHRARVFLRNELATYFARGRRDN